MAYSINANKITFTNGLSNEFEYPIKETLLINDVIIILVKPPLNILYNQNVFAFTLSGDLLWRIAKTDLFYWESDDCPYLGIIINDEDELVLFNWCDTAVIVQPRTGEVIRKYVTK